jgi:hypothetical protein
MPIHAPPIPTRLRTYLLQGMLGIASCAHGADDAPKAKPAPADPGTLLVKAKCVACHQLPEAHALPVAEFADWRDAHKKRVPLSDAEIALVRRFLLPGQAP